MSAVISEKLGTAAVLGLGIIGSRARQHLETHAWDVRCWNRTPKGIPGETVTLEAAVQDAEIISIYLKDAPAVREVMAQIGPALQPGQTLLNHATVDLETTHWLNQQCLERSCRFLDAPFTGSKAAAESGSLIYYIGGDAELAAELDVYLSATSKSRLPCGPVGAATVVKLATNLISACTVQAMSEALAIATHHGVPPECLVHAVSQNVSSSVLSSVKFQAMLTANYETNFSLSNMAKDSRYMLDLAADSQLETPAIAAVSRRMRELENIGLGDFDFSVLAKPYLEES